MPPNTASQHRSERIPNEIWEKYKVDVVREYQEGGTKRALHWIANQQIPDFFPRYATGTMKECSENNNLESLRSYRQLSRQLKVKWQVSETTAGNVDDADTTTVDNGDVNCRNEINARELIAAKMSDVRLQRDPILLRDDSIATQPDDHSKASISISIQEDGNRQSERVKRKTSAILEYDEPSKKKRKEMQQLPHGPCFQISAFCDHDFASEKPDINANADATSQQQITPCQEPNSNFITKSSPEMASFPNDSDTWSVSFDGDEVFDTEVLKVDYKRPMSSYSSKDIERIKNAAEYLFCCAYYEDAFRLYYVVWKKSESDLTTSEFSSRMENFKAIIPLARAATSDINRAMVRDLLHQKLTTTRIFLENIAISSQAGSKVRMR